MAVPSHIVSLTFDDGLDVHMDRVIPMLDARGLAGSFYVTLSALSFAGRLDDWRRAAARGHELGNHTIFHPAWSRKSHITSGNAIESYTLDRMRLELDAANRILAGVDGRPARTFAYPNSNPVIGRPGLAKRLLTRAKLDRTRLMGVVNRHPWLDAGSTQRSYEPVVAELFAAARTGGRSFSSGPDFPPPRFAVPCVSLDGKRIDEVEPVLADFLRQEGGWLVFLAHGVGGGHRLSCDLPVFEWLLGALRAAPVSVLTLRDAAQAVYRA